MNRRTTKNDSPPVVPLLLEGALSSRRRSESHDDSWNGIGDVGLIVDDPREDCSTTASVLDTIDTCINCIEGVEVQRAFDDEWTTLFHPMIDLDVDDAATAPTMSPADCDREQGATVVASQETVEASTIIRLQLMEEKANGRGADAGLLLPSDFDVLHLCGSDGGGGWEEGHSDAFQQQQPTSSPPTTGEEAPRFPTCGPTAACRLEKAVNTTMDTAQTTDIDDSFLSASSSFFPREDENDCDRQQEEDAVLLQCAVCLNEVVARSIQRGDEESTIYGLPCCDRHMCRSCIGALTAPARRDECRVGRCPCCRSWIVVESSFCNSADGATTRPPATTTPSMACASSPTFHLHLVSVAGKCQSCCQVKQLLVDDSSTCDECFIGSSHPPLLYECDCCRHEQRVPRPLYRYQTIPDSFGCVGYPCAACNEVSHWRIRPDQVPLVPVGDAPPGWNENALEKARDRILREGAKSSFPSTTPSLEQASYLHEIAVGSESPSCAIL
jgi:hypothetical protein